MELPKKFNNRESKHIDIFVSRSTAVVGLVFAIVNDETWVLITKRSKHMPSEPRKLCIPCGFLDWDETRHDAMMREVYEETSFYMPDSEEWLVYNNDKKPFISLDNPNEGAQNISEIYISVFNFSDEIKAFPSEISRFTCKEVEFVQWVRISELLKNHETYEWAFDHNNTIIKGWNHWNNLVYNKT